MQRYDMQYVIAIYFLKSRELILITEQTFCWYLAVANYYVFV